MWFFMSQNLGIGLKTLISNMNHPINHLINPPGWFMRWLMGWFMRCLIDEVVNEMVDEVFS